MPGSSHSELVPGSLLGKYRIERLLGHGGMATVYLAVQEGTGLEVALKVLMFRGESNRPGGDVARFIREARLAGGIRHPHWVSVYETGFDAKQNLYYIAMERMQASLAQRLRAHGPLSEPEAIAVVEQIAFALDKAYEAQMVHRDIKPGNILYNAEGVCKLTDFGIAKSSRNEETQLTLREAVFGTPAYMSPEQARDARKVDSRSDIYSLGTVFFELLSGERPYQGETPVQVLAQVIGDKPPPDVRSRPKARKTHSDTAKLVASMMAKDPAARPQTPAELIARLRGLKARLPYAEPAEAPGADIPYDDSTIMDPTNPPSTGIAYGPAGNGESGTDRPQTTGAQTTASWDGTPTKTGGGAGPTFTTQSMPSTVPTRFERPDASGDAGGKGRGGDRRKPSGARVWGIVAGVLVALIVFFGWAAKRDFLPGLFEPDTPPPVIPASPAPAAGGIPAGAGPGGIPEGQKAVLRLRNPHDTPIRVTLTGGLQTQSFEVEPSATVTNAVRAGVETSIRFHAPYSTLYEETAVSPRKIRINPNSGDERPVELKLTPKPQSAPVRTEIEFHNPLGDADVRVDVSGGAESTFVLSPDGRNALPVESGKDIQVKFQVPYSTLYGTGETNLTLGAGDRAVLELRLERTAAADGPTILRLHNPNEAEVFVLLQGGFNGSAGVAPGDTKELLVASDKNTVLSWYAIGSSRFKEISPETAKPGTAAPKAGGTTVDLVLTELAAPVLTVHNVGEVALAVSVGGANATIEPKQAAEFSNLPVDRELRLEWESEQAGFQDDSRSVGPYVWGQKAEERIQSVRMVPPRLEISNDSDWPMKVSVSQVGGTWTAATNRLEGGARWELEVEGAGQYRVRTTAIPDPKSALANPDDYEKYDRTMECRWGMPTEVSCTANPLPGASSDFAIADRLIASVVRGSLRQAVNVAKADWVGHTIQSNIRKIDEALAKAKQYAVAEGVDADGLAAGVASYGEWSESVGAKADISDKPVWQHIVETTESSRNWEEFLANY